MSNTTFPDSAICFLLDDIPGQGEFQATGAIIGPHTILTAAHFVYDADTGASADAVSVYPGFTPGSTTYNPTGALGGVQSIHFIKVADNNEELSGLATQSDFAVINTSVDLSRFGSFALDPDFTSGYVVAKGYPSSNDGNLSGVGGTVAQDGRLSDIGTSGLSLAPGYSGGPLYDTVERNGTVKEAVVGTVSTNLDAMKLNKKKIALIRHWIASDQSLYAGGQDAPRGLIPQIAGTVSDSVNAAHAAAPSGTAPLAAGTGFTYADAAPQGSTATGSAAWAASPFADLVAALHGVPAASEAAASISAGTVATQALAAAALGPRRDDSLVG